MKQQLAILAIALLLFVGGSDAFGWLSRTRRQADAKPANQSATRFVRLLSRKVDAPHPYFKSMFFEVPNELNYGLPGGLILNFTNALERHCNITNITRIVLNDLLLMTSDDDVMMLQDGDRIESTTAKSGPPTRAETAKAFAYKKWRRPAMGIGGGRRSGPGGGPGGRRGGPGGGRRGGRGRDRDDDFAPGGAIVVPDFDGDGEMDP